MTEINCLEGEKIAYEAVLLDDEHHNEEKGTTSGLIIDGITVRVDDLYFTKPENDAEEVEMVIDYKLVDGIPTDITEFESKLSNVIIQIANES